METRINKPTVGGRNFIAAEVTKVSLNCNEHYSLTPIPAAIGKGNEQAKEKAKKKEKGEGKVSAPTQRTILENRQFSYTTVFCQFMKRSETNLGYGTSQLAEGSYRLQLRQGTWPNYYKRIHPPHTWASRDKSKEDANGIEWDYFQVLTEPLLGQKQGKYHIVVGALNTRRHARSENETNVIGPHIFRKDKTLCGKCRT